MIKTVDIKRFRGFKEVRVSDCRAINLVVGENGAGKTSFLEAIFLASSQNPEIALRLRSLRGLAGGTIQGSPVQIEDAMWRDLFYQFDKDKAVQIALGGDPSNAKILNISYEQQGASFPISARDDEPLTAVAPVLFKWKTKSHEYKVRPSIEDGQLKLPAPPRLPIENFFFAANHTYSAAETAGRFSTLSRRFKEAEVVDLLKEHFKNVEGLSIEMVGGIAMVYAHVPSIPEKVPLNLLSAGMSKLASILFAIPIQDRSVVLVDEIENGLYYRRMPIVWKSLHTFCKKYDAQLFASTHSAECINAAAELARQFPDDFSVIQMATKAGESMVRQFGGEKFADALEQDIEIR